MHYVHSRGGALEHFVQTGEYYLIPWDVWDDTAKCANYIMSFTYEGVESRHKLCHWAPKETSYHCHGIVLNYVTWRWEWYYLPKMDGLGVEGIDQTY